MSRSRVVVATLLLGGALVLSVDAIRRVVLRMAFDYDLILWADDYFMTSMLKLAAGEPVYTRLSDANSTVYAPGGPYLHHALLAPFGLETSLLANRVLQQCWLLVAIALATLLVVTLAERAKAFDGVSRALRATCTALAAGLLTLGAYANPVVDSLHPTNLELLVLSATGLSLVHLERFGALGRCVVAVTLGAVGLLVKQTTGASVALALAAALLGLAGSLRRRSAEAFLALLAPVATALALVWWTDGFFKTWGFDVLAAHPFDWWKVRDIYAGHFLLFAPAVLGTVVSIVVGRARDLGYRRVLVLVLCCVPFSLAALFKTMGGPNNLAVIGFLTLILAIPTGLHAFARGQQARRMPLVVAGVAVASQIVLLHPQRRIPDETDFEHARIMCDYAAARSRCREQVLLGRGATCLARGGVRVPRDRMMSVIEATVAGRASELGFYERLRTLQYDVLIFWVADLEWGGRDLWNLLKHRYKPFYATQGALEGDFWYHGWQGFVTWPVVYWERIEDEGRHEVSERGMRCDTAPRRQDDAPAP